MIEENYWYNRLYKRHFIEGKSFICPSTFGESCPICKKDYELRTKYDVFSKGVWKTLPKEVQKILDSLKAQERYIYPAIIKDKLYLIDMPYATFQKKIKEKLENLPEDIEYTFFLDEGGKTAKISFNWVVKGTIKYWEASSVSFEDRKIPNAKLLKTLDTLDIDSILVKTPLEEVKKILEGYEKLSLLEGKSFEEEEEEEETEKVVVSRARKEVVEEKEEPKEIEEFDDNVPFDTDDDKEEEKEESTFGNRRTIKRR